MASFSLGMLGILFLLDICFIVNYFVIRAVRRWTDHKNKNEKHANIADSKSKSQDKSEAKQSQMQRSSHTVNSNYEEFAFAWLMGAIRLEPLNVKKFPEWKPLPYQIGIITTCLLMILSSLLLTPELLVHKLDWAMAIDWDADLCVAEDAAAGLEGFREQLIGMTHLPLARLQHGVLQTIHHAMINDTSLYGITPYQCPSYTSAEMGTNVSGMKSDWQGQDFFPGYCGQALEVALEAAKERECYREVCDCPILPDLAVFQMAGLAGRRFCAAKVCIDVPYPCPAHTSNDKEETLRDYRKRQYETAEQRQRELANEQFNRTRSTIPESVETKASHTADKILYQVDVASYIYIGYSCIALLFPAPLILFRVPYWISIKRFLFGVQKPYFILLAVTLWWGVEYFRAIWVSPDLQYFLNHLKIMRFNPCFMDADYLLQRHNTIDQVCQELLSLEPEINESAMTVTDILREVHFFAESCECYFPNHHLAQAVSALFDNVITTNISWQKLGFSLTNLDVCASTQNVDSGCSIYLPNDDLSYLGNSTICTNSTAKLDMVWQSHTPSLDDPNQTDWYNLWVASGFLALLVVKIAMANFGLSLMTLADPFSICAGEFLWMPTDLGRSGNGKGAMTRTPSRRERLQMQMEDVLDEKGNVILPQELVQKWFKTKQRALFHVGLSKVVFWGFLVHLCMTNLFRTVYQEAYKGIDVGDANETIPPLYDLLEQRDMTVFGSCLGVGLLVAVFGGWICHKLKTLRETEFLPDTDSSSSDDDESNSLHLKHDDTDQMQDIVIQLDTDAEAYFSKR